MRIIKENVWENGCFFSLVKEIPHRRTIHVRIFNENSIQINSFHTTIHFSNYFYYLLQYTLNTTYLRLLDKNHIYSFKNSIATICLPISNLNCKDAVNMFWNSPFDFQNQYLGMDKLKYQDDILFKLLKRNKHDRN